MPLLDEHLTEEEKPQESTKKKGLSELQQILYGLVTAGIWAGINGVSYLIGFSMVYGITASMLFLVVVLIILKRKGVL
jgi:hypothetical protein